MTTPVGGLIAGVRFPRKDKKGGCEIWRCFLPEDAVRGGASMLGRWILIKARRVRVYEYGTF